MAHEMGRDEIIQREKEDFRIKRKKEEASWFAKTAGIAALSLGIGIAAATAYNSYENGIRKIGRTLDSAYTAVFSEDAKFAIPYKGEWEAHEIKTSDGRAPVENIAGKCAKELGLNSKYWDDEIITHNGIDPRKLHVGDTIYVPKGCISE